MNKQGKPPAPSESDEQQALFRWAEYMAGQYPILRRMFHIANEGKRSRATGARMKAEGLKHGLPDICLPTARNGYHGLYIEMKAGSNTPTPEQKDWIEALGNEGYATAVCWGWEQAARVITKYLGVKEYER